MSLSPPPGLTSAKLLPTWERAHWIGGYRRVGLSIGRNPYRHLMWDKLRDDAVTVRYWNFSILLKWGFHRWAWWHFVERPNRRPYGLS